MSFKTEFAHGRLRHGSRIRAFTVYRYNSFPKQASKEASDEDLL